MEEQRRAALIAGANTRFQLGVIQDVGPPPIQLPPPPMDPRDTHKTWIENGINISHLITSERAEVIKWIQARIPAAGPVIIGVSVEHGAETAGSEKADVITLYIKDHRPLPKGLPRGYCLSYQISRVRICDEMQRLLHQDRCRFVGKKSANGIKNMRMLITSKILKDKHASEGGGISARSMPTMFECGPAEMYLEGARQLLRRHSTKEVPFNWRARVFTDDQARYTCLNALVGWLFTHGQPLHLLNRGESLIPRPPPPPP